MAPKLPGGKPISVSSYGTYLVCALRFFFDKVEQRPRAESEVPTHWRFGSVIHAGLEAAYIDFRDRKLVGSLSQSADAGVKGIRDAWVQYEMPTGDGELDRALGMTLETLSRLVERHDHILGIEEWIRGPLPETGAQFVGAIDLLRRVDDETVEIRDYKVRAKVSTPEELVREIQGPSYAHFVRRAHPWAKRVMFSHLYPNKGNQLVIAELDDETIRNAVERLDAVADMLYEARGDMDNYPPRRSEECGNCNHRDVCPAWNTPEDRADEEAADLKRMMNF